MKTVFKKDQEVYDQIYRKGKKGSVRFISMNDIKSYIVVDFEDSDSALYTLNGNYIDLEINFTDANPTLSTTPYKDNFEGFSQEEVIEEDVKELEEATKWLEEKDKRYVADINYEKEAYISEESFIAFNALKYLVFLVEYYNRDWKPDWSDINQEKYTIRFCKDDFYVCTDFFTKGLLSFKTKELAKRFFKTQRDLIEMAKPLL
jgi:hypothetical protein